MFFAFFYTENVRENDLFWAGYLGEALFRWLSRATFNGQQSRGVARTTLAQLGELRRLVHVSVTESSVFPMLGMRG